MAQQALRLDALGEDVDAFWVDEGPVGSGDPSGTKKGRFVERISNFGQMNNANV